MKLLILIATLSLISCGPKKRPILDSDSGPGKILVTGLRDSNALRQQAQKLGLSVQGDVVLQIAGDAKSLGQLSVNDTEDFLVIKDQPIRVEKPQASENPDDKIYYMAKRDFGIPEFQKKYPQADGRNVTVALIDDGVSPNVPAFQKTTTGARKLLKKGWNSTLLDRTLAEVTDPTKGSGYLQSVTIPYTKSYEAAIDEAALTALDQSQGLDTPKDLKKGYLDLNRDGKASSIGAIVLETTDGVRVCVDANANGLAEAAECFGVFSETGEFGFWTEDKKISFIAEFNRESRLLELTRGEVEGDSHGEGVASVLTGHQIGGLFDGVAPGATLLDYDLGEYTIRPEEETYTIGTFVAGLEWLGQNGAEVVNISYSIFFESADAQAFSRGALQALIKKYNYVISFSAGNNGPGLGSLNRRNMYPENSLVAGAFVSKDLDEHVHGVTGLPEEGRVVFYSSRGPGPDGGRGPLVISPLASLTHSDPYTGYQSFSGTSSASPALAGMAAVLISAIKQNGWKVDPMTLVHAIRLSGKPLPGVAFIDQGAGLPQIEKALEVYGLLVSGQQFASITTTVSANCPDGVTCTGFLGKLSQIKENETELLVQFKGQVSPVAASRTGPLLKLVTIKYNADWLAGPNNLWVGEGSSSRIYLKIDAAAARRASLPGRELTGEVAIYDTETELKLHTVPITLLNDATESFQTVVDPQTEEGLRVHLTTDAMAVRVQVDSAEGKKSLIRYRVYDPNGVAIANISNVDEFVFPTSQSGSYQIGVFRPYGTNAKGSVSLTVEPIRLQLLSKVAGANRLVIENRGEVTDGNLIFKIEPKTVASSTETVDGSGEWSLTTKISKPGNYALVTKTLTAPAMTYPYDSCYSIFSPEDGGKPVPNSGSKFSLKPNSSGQIEFRCRPFEHSGTDWKAGPRSLELVWSDPEYNKSVLEMPVRLRNGRNNITLKNILGLTPGATYEVWHQALFGAGEVLLGTIQYLP